MFLRIICQGSHSHGAWQHDFFFVFESFSMCLNVVFVYSLCFLLMYRILCYALCSLFSGTCESYLGDGKYKGEEDGIKPETPHVNREHTRQAKYPNLTHLKMIMLIICRFWFGLLFFFS